MSKIVIWIIFLFISIKSISQSKLYVSEDFMNRYRNVLLNTSKNYAKDEIEGSPYTTDDFVFGTVSGYERTFLLKYDAFNDEMLVKHDEKRFVIINKEAINKVQFNDSTTYIVLNYPFDGSKKKGYLQVLYTNSRLSLLKKEVIIFSPAENPASGYDQPKPPTFKKARSHYFISLSEGGVNLFYKKKDFLKIFPENKAAIEKFIKSNKIRFTKEKDLVKLVKHIETIL